jgi:hypothetical protein
MNMFREVLIFSIVVCSVLSNEFAKYHKYANTSILATYLSDLRVLEEPIKESAYSSWILCISTCNELLNCSAFTLSDRNECALLNNQTAIMHTTFSNNSNLFSLTKLNKCSSDYYIEPVQQICSRKKSYEMSCLSANECLSSLGLICLNSTCLCSQTE